MPRERLPHRRRSVTQKVKIADVNGVPQTFYLSCGYYDDGRLGEIFLEAHKEGTFARGVLSTLARVVSIALQCGAEPAALAGAMRHMNFPPSGPVEGTPTTEHCTSVADWIAQELVALQTFLSPDGVSHAAT